jgi:hypothetical protein
MNISTEDDVSLAIVAVTLIAIVALIGGISMLAAGYTATQTVALVGSIGTITGQIVGLARGRSNGNNGKN